jgi:hypothetical protein
MHPIVAHELIRASQRELTERVGSPRRPLPATKRRWFRRAK